MFTGSLSLRIFQIPSVFPSHLRIQPERVVPRAHDAPVHVSKVDPTSTYLASGAADGVVKVWDIRNGYVTHVFKGHGGVVSALAFNYPRDPSNVVADVKMQLITGSVDSRIRIFDLNSRGAAKSKADAVLEGHVSVPRGLDVSKDGRWLISGGRDSVVLLWDLSIGHSSSRGKPKGKGKDDIPMLVKTIPVLERVEAVGIVQADETLTGSSSTSKAIQFYVAGEKGVVSVWDSQKGSIIFTIGKPTSADEEESRQILDAMCVPSMTFRVIL